ncbi:MAG: BLUF domain-containing protein [Hyphomicrobiales bacterium]|nr:BLUF domain-containing protein [Hyphomicrobiales bacterium]
MMMIRLMYYSRHRLDGWYKSKAEGIADIEALAAANNRRDDITGALMYDECWFVQALEGTEIKLSAAFERILRDQRHCEVSLVTMQAINERRYPGCAMLSVARSGDNDDLFRHYGENDRFDPRQMRADRLADLIEAVVQRALSRPAGGSAPPAPSAA